MNLTTKMFNRKTSIYTCPVDKTHIVTAERDSVIICLYCRVKMEERLRGIVNKSGKN